MSDIEREAFETAIKKVGGFSTDRGVDGEYRMPNTFAAWRVWQAARQAPASVDAVAFIRECQYGNSFPCNPCCEDFGYCSTKKVEAHPPAKVPEGWKLVPLQITAGQLSAAWHNHALNIEDADTIYQSFLVNAPQAPSTPTPATTPEAEWVKCEDKVPEPARNTRRNQNGILVRFDSGRIERFKEVTEYLVNFMKNGPRTPTKYEAPMPERATHWMYIIPPTAQEG